MIPPTRRGGFAPSRSGRRRRRRGGCAPRGGGHSFVLVTLALALAVAVPCFGTPPDDLLAVGKKAFGEGQYALAISSLQRIQDEYPESPGSEEAGYLLGVSLFSAGRWADSLSAFSLLGIRYPKSSLISRAEYWVGAANLRLGHWQSAFDNLSAFLHGRTDTGPYRLSALLGRAVALEGLGRDAEAGAAYRQLLLDPSARAYSAEATWRLAATEYRAGNYGAARDLYGKVLIEDTGSPFVRDAVFFAGECELALGRLAEAEKRFLTLLSLYPDSPYVEAASFRLVDISWRQKRASAFRQVEDFLARFPGGAHQGSALRLKGDILLAQKKSADALEAYTRSVAALPDGAEKQSLYYSMALAQEALGRKLDAADSFAHAGSGGSDEIAERAGFQRAVLLAGEGKGKEAIEALRAFGRAFPRSARAEEAERLLGTLLEKQGDPEASRALWDSLAQRFPGSPSLPEYISSRGRNLLVLGQWALALDDFQRVIKGNGNPSWTGRSAYSIGYVYALRGEYPRALPFFQLASKVAPAGNEAARGTLAAAICLFNMGRFDQALSALRSLQASRAPSLSAGNLALYAGKSLYRLGRLNEAAAQLNEAAASLAAERSPLGADAHYWRGWALLRLRKPSDAYSSFLAVAEGYPADQRRGESLFRAAVCETMQGDDASAVTLYEEVITEPQPGPAQGDGAPSPAPIVEQAMYERAQALSRLGREQESAAALDQLARAFPSGRLAPQAFYARAERALSEGRYAEAHAGFDRAAHGFPDSPLADTAAYWAAESLLRAGEVRGSLDEFWACLASKSSPAVLSVTIEGFTGALNKMGDVETARYFSQKVGSSTALGVEASAGVRLASADVLLASAPEEALALITEVRRAAPPEPFAGEASLLMGRYAESRGDWNRALDIFGALEGSRADDVGARAAIEKGRTLEAMGRTADAVDEYLKVAYLFPDLGDRAAEGMAAAVRVSRARGDTGRSARIEQALRTNYPASPWLDTLSGD